MSRRRARLNQPGNLKFFLFMICLSLSVYHGSDLYRYLNTPFEPLRPIVGEVKAMEAVQIVSEPAKPLTVEDKIRATFPEDPDTAVAIAKCESTMNPKAFNGKNTNGSWDAGLFQINSVHKYSKEHLFDVDNNLRAARKLYERQGWNPWVCLYKI